MSKTLLIIGAAIALLTGGYNASADITLRLFISTSINDSGLINYLIPSFKQRHSLSIDISVVGTGKALQMGRIGAADVVWVHSPSDEQKFVAEGYGINRRTVMRSDFVLAGPAHDPAQVAGSGDIVTAMQRIAERRAMFVSRGDDSGNNKRELALWRKAKLDPYGSDWYLETGAGMADSLALAETKDAYILIDRATFLVHRSAEYQLLLEDSANLANPYSVIAINPARNSNANLEAARVFIDWLISPEGQQLIADFKHQGQQLYFPSADSDQP